MPIEFVKDKWPGKVRPITIGATAAEGGTRSTTVTVGGEKSLPFMHSDSEIPHRPVVAVEIKDRFPEDWSALLAEAWGDVMNDPAAWAKAAEADGADMIVLALSATDKDGTPTTPAGAVAAVKSVLAATGLPLAVFRTRSGRAG
jgi:acetyl-CoA decarbonylase/synthase, CODH/ACS complex subunit delta